MMFYRKDEYTQGEYISADGTRIILSQARNVRPTKGWTRFNSREDCLAAWDLTYNPQPEAKLFGDYQRK